MPDASADCLIVGGGPAGLVAATYLGRFRRKVILVDSAQSRAAWIPVTHNLIGFSEGISGPDLLGRMRRQADQYSAERLHGVIENIEVLPDGSFVGSSTVGRIVVRKVLIATGGLDIEPKINNAAAAVSAGLIRHCPICDAFEATGRKIALIAYGECRVKEAMMLRGYTSDLTVLTFGNPMQLSVADRQSLEAAGIRIIPSPVEKLCRRDNDIAAWISDRPDPLIFDTVYSALGTRLRSELALALGAKADDDGALLVDRHQQTTVPGLYAAGDVVQGLSQVSVAAGQAAIAATAINAGLPYIRY